MFFERFSAEILNPSAVFVAVYIWAALGGRPATRSSHAWSPFLIRFETLLSETHTPCPNLSSGTKGKTLCQSVDFEIRSHKTKILDLSILNYAIEFDATASDFKVLTFPPKVSSNLGRIHSGIQFNRNVIFLSRSQRHPDCRSQGRFWPVFHSFFSMTASKWSSLE